MGGRALNYPRGKVIGRRSAIKGMIDIRGQARGADAFHGAGGEWRVDEMRLSWEILDAWREAAADCGVPPNRVLQSRR